jgi:hypothetical protein
MITANFHHPAARGAFLTIVMCAVMGCAGQGQGMPADNATIQSVSPATRVASAPSASSNGTPLEFVQFGGSWIAGEHCGGCTTFAGLWVEDIKTRTGRAVHVTDFTGHNERSASDEKTTSSLLSALKHDKTTIAAVRKADIVLISDGGNDLPLIGDQLIDGSCEADGYACVKPLGRLWHHNFEAIVERITRLRHGRPTAIRLVLDGGANPFLGDSDLYDLVTPQVALEGGAVIVNAELKAICDAAKKHRAKCLDTRSLLTGPHFDQRFDENAPETFRALADALSATGLPELGI